MDSRNITEKPLHPASGFFVLIFGILGWAASIPARVFGILRVDAQQAVSGAALIVLSAVLFIVMPVLLCGLKVVSPNEARVLTLFGKYYGTLKTAGFYFVNPFCASFSPAYNAARTAAQQRMKEAAAQGKSVSISIPTGKGISLKTQTLDNGRQKVNDVLGNPIIIGAIVIWRVADPTRAVFAVENYQEYLSIQTDSIIRNTARLYPYDIFDEDEDDGVKEKSLRGSSLEITENMKHDLAVRVADAGLVIEDVRITHLAYAEEIAAAMLQRQQAAAIIAARQKIVDGAVGMVKMAIDKLGEDEIVVLDEERKAAMVSNLLVVLCGNRDAQPVVNSGSIY